MAGIDNTLALLDGLEALAVEVKVLVKDGVQFADLNQLLADYEGKPDFKVKVDKLFELVLSWAKLVNPELQDLSIFEYISLGRRLLKLIDAVK